MGKVEDEGPDEILSVGALVRILAPAGFFKKYTDGLTEDKSDIPMFSPVNSCFHSLYIPGAWDTQRRGQ